MENRISREPQHAQALYLVIPEKESIKVPGTRIFS